jgi:glycosyltransferase involved in cell wall biosynthesis
MNSNSPKSKNLSIAILGTRGIPANYGGFETFAEELSTRLTERGHKVTVYGRRFSFSSPKYDSYKNVTIVNTITVKHKYLETPIHAISSNLDLLFRKIKSKLTNEDFYDVALLCNAANSPFAWIINACLLPLAINVDGIERFRTKWNKIGKLWYRVGEIASCIFATKVIGDADVICEYYRDTYKTESIMIPYGANIVKTNKQEILETLNIRKNNYALYVSRLEPENNALGVIDAYKILHSKYPNLEIPPLVIVGDAPYADEYKNLLRQSAKGYNVIFAGFQFGSNYHQLRSHCLIYIQATEVGGTHPALVEGLAYGNPTIVNGTPENIEVVADAALIYEKNNFNDLAEKIYQLLYNPELREQLAIKGQTRCDHKYSWSKVVKDYEALFLSLAKDD